MPFQPAPGTIGVQVECRLSGQQTINDLYFFQNGADPTIGDCLTIADLVRLWWIENILPNLSETLVAFRVIAKNLFVNGGAKGIIGFSGETGGIATEQAPNNVAAVVTFDTGQAGKSSHGRNYIPGVPNANITVNTIDSAFITAITDAYKQLLPGGLADPAPYFWSVLSRQSGGVVAAQATAVPVANVYFTDNIVDSQRRRLPGRGK